MFAMGPAFFSGASGALSLSGTFPAAVIGVPYDQYLTIAGGSTPYSLTGGTGLASGTLPAGLTLSIASTTHLRLSGTPTGTAGTSSFTASVGSADGQTATSTQSIVVSAADPYFSNVIFLLHCNGPNLSTTLTDVTGRIWTMRGSSGHLDTGWKAFGTTSYYIGTGWSPSSNQGATTPATADFNFGTGDFTIEWTQYWDNAVDFQTIFDNGGTAAGALLIQTGNGDSKYHVYVSGVSICAETTAPAFKAASQYMLRKISGVYELYRNGVLTASASNTTAITGSAGSVAWGAYASGANGSPNYIDELRGTKGVARANTIQTAPFPDS